MKKIIFLLIIIILLYLIVFYLVGFINRDNLAEKIDSNCYFAFDLDTYLGEILVCNDTKYEKVKYFFCDGTTTSICYIKYENK